MDAQFRRPFWGQIGIIDPDFGPQPLEPPDYFAPGVAGPDDANAVASQFLPHTDAFGRGPTAAFFENPVKAMHLTQREQDEQDRHFGDGGRNGDSGVGDLNALGKNARWQHLLDAPGGMGNQLKIGGRS